MKWDIDKALAPFEPELSKGTSLVRTLLSFEELRQLGFKVKPGTAGYTEVWCLTLGKTRGPKLTYYGISIHEAYLRAKKDIRHLKGKESLAVMGLKAPKKKRNSFNSARKRK